MHVRTGWRAIVPLVASLAFACENGGGEGHTLDLARSELRITSADPVVADGVQAVHLELIARDTGGRPMAGVAPTLVVSGSGNTLSAWTGSGGEATRTPSDGILQATLASTRAEVKQVRATLEAGGVEGAAAQELQVTFVAGAASADRSELTPPPGNTIADGLTTASVTVTVRDAQGNPVPGAAVAAVASGGATSNGPFTTRTDGTVTFSVTSTHAGTTDVTFTSGTITLGTTQVVYAAGQAVALVMGPVDSIVTAGQPLSPLEVQVVDAQGNVVPGASAPVTLSLSANPGADQLGGTISRVPTAGVAIFGDVVLHKAGAGYRLAAESAGFAPVTSSAIDVTAAAADAGHTLVQAVGSPTVGSSQGLTVTVRDAYDNPVSGELVAFSATGGAQVSGGGVSGADGVVTGSVTTTVAGPVTLSAYLLLTPVVQTATVTFDPAAPAPGGSTAVAGSAAVADGSSTTTITVTVKDAYGNPVPNATVAASASNGALVDGPHPSGPDGTATFTVTSTTAGGSTITFTSGGVTLGSGVVSFVAGQAARLAFASAPASAVAGQPLSAVTVRVLDAHGNRVSTGSSIVAISAASAPSGESLAGTLTAPTVAGIATFSDLALHKAGSTTLQATANGLAGASSSSISVAHAAADTGQTLVTAASPTAVVGDGVAITVTVLDAYGNPVPGQAVTLSTVPGSASVVQPVGPSASNGTAAGSISTVVSGAVTVTARLGAAAVAQTASVTYQPGAVDADQSTFTASSASLVADGSATSTLQVVASDVHGNPVPAQAVVFSASGSNIFVQGGPTDAAGHAQGTIASGEAGTKTLTATVGGVVLSAHPTISFSAAGGPQPSASSSTVVPAPATIQADGTTQTSIVVTVKDSTGVALPGVAVTLALTSGTGTLTQPMGVTDGAGVATGHLSASAAGTGTVAATAGGVTLAQRATVTYVKPISETVPPTKVPVPIGVNCTSQYSNTGRKITIDQANNIYVVMSCDGTAYAAVSTDLGKSYSTAASLGITGVAEVSTVGGPAGVAYALVIDSSSAAWFSRTTDSGATWSAPVQIESSASANYGATIAVDNDRVYVACNIGGTVRVFRNSTQGSETFDYTDVSVSAVFGDVLTDNDGSVWVTTDDPTFHILRSTDAGVSFGPESNPSGSANYSDWSIGNGIMWAAGTQTYATRIPAAAPGTSSPVTDLVPAEARGRAVSADKAGNAYVSSGMSGTGVTLQRALAADSAFDAGRLIDANGSWPGVVAGPGNNTAILVYTVGNEVWASVQVY